MKNRTAVIMLWVLNQLFVLPAFSEGRMEGLTYQMLGSPTVAEMEKCSSYLPLGRWAEGGGANKTDALLYRDQMLSGGAIHATVYEGSYRQYVVAQVWGTETPGSRCLLLFTTFVRTD